MTAPLVQVENLTRHFAGKRGLFTWAAPPIRAVEDVSFSIAPGEVVGLVGESGSGKSTIGRTLLRLVEPTRGTVRFRGDDIGQISAAALRKLRQHMQIVFQDPYASLDPRKRVEDIIGGRI